MVYFVRVVGIEYVMYKRYLNNEVILIVRYISRVYNLFVVIVFVMFIKDFNFVYWVRYSKFLG